MTNFASRLLVAVIGLPLVLGMLWLGGWWLFTLVAVASCVAVHEFVTTARPLRPLAPAVYAGVLLALFGAEKGGVVWLLGRHKLAPRLSPNKSWEGLLIGAFAGVFVSFIALWDTRNDYLSVWQAIVLGVVLVVAEVMGDLFESAVKRDLEVKDTGRLLGGHGGMLDRIDGLLFAAPAAFFLVTAYGFH